MTHETEKNYYQKLTPAEQRWVDNKPFPADSEGKLFSSDPARLREGLQELFNFTLLLNSAGARPGELLLDLGGGSGWLAALAVRFGLRPVLVDIALSMCQASRRGNGIGTAFSAINAAAGALPITTAALDICLVNGAFHHLDDSLSAAREIYRVLKPGGRLALAEPGKGHATSDAAQLAREKYEVSEHELPPGRLVDILTAAGFAEIKIKPQLAEDLFLDPDGLASLCQAETLTPAQKVWRYLCQLIPGVPGPGAVLELQQNLIVNIATVTQQRAVVVARK